VLPVKRLATGEYGNAREDADEVIRTEGLKLAPQSPEHELLSREMLKARIRFLQVEQRRTWGDYSDKVAPVPTLMPLWGFQRELPPTQGIL